MKGNETEEAVNKQPKKNGSIWVDGMLIFLLPFVSVLIEHVAMQTPLNWNLFGKWFMFWAFGFRLFTSGIKQASDPSFGITKINTADKEFYEMIRELGIVNICLGVGGILSLINDTWRQIIAILGCLFFGLDAVRCFATGLPSVNQKRILLLKLIAFTILFLYMIFDLKTF